MFDVIILLVIFLPFIFHQRLVYPRNSSSESTTTFNSCALVSFEPATAPAITKSVFVKIFEGNQIRSLWDEEKEECFFSVVDIIAVLTDSANPRRYWSDLKRKLQLEERANELYEKNRTTEI